MNATTAPLEVCWIVQASLALAICLWNYHDCWHDVRALEAIRRNGLLLLASADARQAEMFRAFIATTLVATGLIVAGLPGAASVGITPGTWVQWFLVLANTAVGLSSIRARVNRKRQIEYVPPLQPWMGHERRKGT